VYSMYPGQADVKYGKAILLSFIGLMMRRKRNPVYIGCEPWVPSCRNLCRQLL